MNRDVIRGAQFILASEFMLVTMGVIIKWLAQDLPNEMLVFARNVMGLVFIVPLLLAQNVAAFKTTQLKFHMLRSLAGVSAMYCFFYAIGHLKLADAMLLKMTVPLFIPVIAWFMLRERIGFWPRAGLLLGFFGVLIFLHPDADFNPIFLIALSGSVLAAVAKTTIRRLTRTEPTLRIIFYFALVATLVSVVPLIWAWQTPAGIQWWGLLALGPVATLAQIFMTRGYAAAAAGSVGLYSYSAVLYGAAFGWLFWGELWDGWAITGAVIIAASGVLALNQSPMNKQES